MAVAFRELGGSPRESISASGFKAERRFIVAWADRLSFVLELLGASSVYGGTEPSTYPAFPGTVVEDIQIEPFMGQEDKATYQVFTDLSVGINSYAYALVTAKYTPVEMESGTGGGQSETNDPDKPETDPETYLTRSVKAGGEFMLLPASGLKGEDGDSAVGVPQETDPPVDPDARIVRFVSTQEITWTWAKVASPPYKWLDSLRGHVCSGRWPTKSLYHPAETLLYMGYDLEQEKRYYPPGYTGKRTDTYKLTITLKSKRIVYNNKTYGWLHAYRSKPTNKAGFYRPVDQNGKTNYPTATPAQFDNLFKQIVPAPPEWA